LRSSDGVAGNKDIVERVRKADLNGHGAFGSRTVRVGAIRKDDLGNRCRQTL
jgi:hypothetical protein